MPQNDRAMGMTLLADRSKPIPYPITLLVSCDGDHGFLPTNAVFAANAADEHTRAPAMRSGWKFDGEGRVLCPRCARRASA